MAREEAINELIRHKQEMQNDFGWNTTLQTALNMAIEALKATECENAVDRDTILQEMEKRHKEGDAITLGYIKNLPPVTPKPKTGHWIKHKDGYHRCSECGSRGSAIKAHYCHHCGAKMEGVSE